MENQSDPQKKPLFSASVVIPTYNRIDVLGKTLKALDDQTLSLQSYEVIVVDDGSNEDVRIEIQSLHLPYFTQILGQEKRGPAAARNLGASHAVGEIIVFLDNDIVVTPDLLRAHIESHRDHPNCLVVGPRSPLPRPGVEDIFEMFDYGPDGSDLRLLKESLTFQEAFTCNLSIRREDWLRLQGFNDLFPSNSYEDIEFAYRAVKSGMSVIMEPSALGFHNHPSSFEQRFQRAVSYTSTVPLLYQLHPELRGKIIHLCDKEPIDWKFDSPTLILRKITRSILALKPIIYINKSIFHILKERPASRRWLEFFYWKILGGYQWIGLRQGIQQYGW